tara:strand:+ start:402 stop:650 length:249 start_codon:yes stop_codon:yes gene_type:complete
MTREELLELIRSVIREYTGTGNMSSTGLTSDDGNNVTSPRPFANDKDEIENYINKNVYGAEGGHYKKEPAFHNPNRTKFTKF